MWRFLGYLFGIGFMLFTIAVGGVMYVVWNVSQSLPDYAALKQYSPPVMTRVHAANGALLAEYARQRRLYVPINAIPPRLIQAFLSAEDKNFYHHQGIDMTGVARAIIVNLRNLSSGRRMIGASTITQQVAKNFLLSSDRTLDRKLKEALLALKIEKAFSKNKILELYLNEIFFGLSSYGVAAASLNYFGKSLYQLDLADVAYLAALPKAPNNYHPFRHAKRAIERRNWVLRRMMENGYVTEQEAFEASKKPLNINPRPFGAQLFAADYFAEEVRRRVSAKFGEKMLLEGGLSVRTTLDPKMQEMARKVLVDGLVRFDRSQGWRGPVAQIPLAKEWGMELGGVNALSDIAPWRLGVVLEIGTKWAKLGLQPGRLKGGKLEESRQIVTITLKHAEWARKALPQDEDKKTSKKVVKLDKKPQNMAEILSPGNVVYLAPVIDKPKTAKTKTGKPETGAPEIWELMQVPKVEGALVALDPHTGRVHALVGGFSFGASQFNRAVQAKRQPGSVFKPFVYAAALDSGYTPSTLVMDAPIEVDQGNNLGLWRPKNYGNAYYGPSTLRIGIERSRNVMTVRLAQHMGMDKVQDYARRFGIYDNMRPLLSMSLGAGETTLLRMTAAFGMLANGGKKIIPALIDRIQDRYGRTIFKHDNRVCPDCVASSWQQQIEPHLADIREQIIDPHTAYQVVSMLEGVVQRGTAKVVAQVGKPLAGKTGTTNDEKDAWFVGFAPDLAVGVFIGFDKPQPMGRKASGGKLAAPIFRDFMKLALKFKPAIPFRAPPGLNLIPINTKTGMPGALGQEGVILEVFKPGEGPPTEFFVIGTDPNWMGTAIGPGPQQFPNQVFRQGSDPARVGPFKNRPVQQPFPRRNFPTTPDEAQDKRLTTGSGGLY